MFEKLNDYFSELLIGDYKGDNMDDIYCNDNGRTSVSPSVIKCVNMFLLKKNSNVSEYNTKMNILNQLA